MQAADDIAVDDESIRAFNLVSESPLDDRAVEELARSIRSAGETALEAVGSVTRRESTFELGETLDPVDLEAVLSLGGLLLLVRDPANPDDVLGAVHLEAEAAVALADLFLGGPGRGAQRNLTEIEVLAITRSAPGIVGPLASAATYRDDFTVALELAADPIRLPMSLVRMAWTLGVGSESITGALFVPDPDRSAPSASAGANSVVTASVARMPIELDIELASVEMPVSDIRALAEGDVVIFDDPPDGNVTARHGHHRLLDGRLMETAGRRTLEVTKVLTS